jgi:sec-independent protein translocase protein TatC
VQDKEMGFLDHIAELRRRLLWVATTFVLAAAGSFCFSPQLVAFLTSPVKDGLVVLRPGEAFYVHLQVSLAAAVIINIPIIIYHLFAFIFPGLTPSERRWVWMSVPPILGLFTGGVLFAWFVVLPYVYRFFMGFTSESLRPFISVGNYISFVTGMVIPFGVVFELPVLIAFLTGVGILTPAFLSSYRKIAILIIFIIAAILTPPDVVSQTLLALPLIALYEASVGVSRIVHRRRRRALAALEDGDGDTLAA